MRRILYQITSSYGKLPVARSDKYCSQIRMMSSQDEVERRSHLFTLEKRRQLDAVGRIEKIEVQYLGVPNDATLVMNKDVSTPFDCARHLGEIHWRRSALALIDGSIIWDMHRPLTNSCTLELQHFMIPDPLQVNRAFWRTCSFVMGALINSSFKDKVNVKLHSFPGPDVRSGSFVYDVDLEGLQDWAPTQQELYCLSADFTKLAWKDLLIERLDVSKELALEMFKENEHKTTQIPNIARKNEGNVTLYRMGNHVDISKGPMVSHSGLIGRVTLTAVHQLLAPENHHPAKLYRFQGVALPRGILVKYFIYNSILEERAKKLNPARTPYDPFVYNTNLPEKREVAA